MSDKETRIADQSPIAITRLATDHDPHLRAIRDAFTAELKAVGVRQIGPSGSAELLWRLGQLIAGRNRHVRIRKRRNYSQGSEHGRISTLED